MNDNFNIEMEEVSPLATHSIWAEKYRPLILENFIGSDVVKERFSRWIENKDLGHILLHGSPGVGKTSLAKIIINHIPCDSLIINASDENGIDSIRDKIKDFAMTIGMQPLKIIFCDECDRMTALAQDALKVIVDTYSESTRFIFAANYPERITPAIKSRCQSFEIRPPSKPEIMKHLVHILDAENVTYKKEDVAFVINSYFPDIRKIINFSQQSNIGGELKIVKANTLDQDYRTKLVELLKTPSKAGVFTEIRQVVADASFSNYEEVYKFLFAHVNEFAGEKAPEAILTIADAVYQSALVFEREITFVAAMHRLITLLNRK